MTFLTCKTLPVLAVLLWTIVSVSAADVQQLPLLRDRGDGQETPNSDKLRQLVDVKSFPKQMAMTSSLRMRRLHLPQIDRTPVSAAINRRNRHTRKHDIKSHAKREHGAALPRNNGSHRDGPNKRHGQIRSEGHMPRARPARTQGGQSRVPDESEHSKNRYAGYDDDDWYGDDDWYVWYDDDYY